MVDNITPARALGFLLWFRKFYGGSTAESYKQISANYGQCNYGTVRNYLLELQNYGYIQIENPGKWVQRFTVIESKFAELIKK